MSIPPVLLVDADQNFLEKIAQEPTAKKRPPVMATSREQAEGRMADRAQEFSAIFLNPSVSEARGLPLIRFAHQHRLGTPLFLLYDDEYQMFSPRELTQVAVVEALHKPVLYADMVNLVAPLVQGFDVDAALAQSRLREDVGGEVTEEDAHFVAIRAANFLSGKKSFFDVYLRLSSGRYLKLLRAGEEFEADRITNYLKKGIDVLYLRKEAQATYLGYCDHLTYALVRHPSVPRHLKTAQTLNLGEEALKFLHNRGFSYSSLVSAGQFVETAQELLVQIELDDNDAVRSLLDDATAYEHGVATAIIASLLIAPLKIESERARKLIGLAALIHDIGLRELPEKLRSENESAMTDEERILYRKHPELGAKMLNPVRGVETIVVQAIAQHHERRDGTGFPQRTGPGRINRIAEIVGISEAFANLIARAKIEPELNIFDVMHERVFDGYSAAVVDAFCVAFSRRRV